MNEEELMEQYTSVQVGKFVADSLERKEVHGELLSSKKELGTNEKLQVVSLFSGSGGLDLGFLATNQFEIIFANDFNEQACKTYSHNIGNHIRCGDISKVRGLKQADVLIGGPPCQGFSTANPARSFEDPRNQLFKEYSRILKEVKPKVFLMENVSGMTTMQNGQVFRIIKKELAECGYKIFDRLLNAKDFGVPQNRRRIFIVGVRNDIQGDFVFPVPVEQHCNTIRELFLDNEIEENDPNHVISKLTPLNKKRLEFIPPGGSMKDCPADLRNNSDTKRAMRRLDLDKVSYTIVHNNCDHYYHPTEDRRITIREMARIQGYPDTYIFFGSKSEQSKQVGNSVPIQLAKAMAEGIYTFLKTNNI
ncbi:DNA cytosine methyltransferase [Pedobacter sp. SAFR-022]|uniref:DNA cytosine methyltransferase n=1 Tax=Pedobacter sp. SAFR-022 TaxID=3436861 RepID=UPI003F819458